MSLRCGTFFISIQNKNFSLIASIFALPWHTEISGQALFVVQRKYKLIVTL